MNQNPITTFFLDIGGVLLTNGWSHDLRKRAADKFGLDYDDMDERHNLTFGTYEEGKLSLDKYLNRVVFFKNRPFTNQGCPSPGFDTPLKGIHIKKAKKNGRIRHDRSWSK